MAASASHVPFRSAIRTGAARHPHYIAAVAPASYLKMGRAQGVEPEAGDERFVTG